MLDLDHIPEPILADLEKRGHSREDVAQMSAEGAFSEYCNWRGLLGWGPRLWQAVACFKRAAQEAPVPAKAVSAEFLHICQEEVLRARLTSLPLKLEFGKTRGMTLDEVHNWMLATRAAFENAVAAAA